MFIFKKTRDDNRAADPIIEIKMKVEDNYTLDHVIESFEYFLKTSGFHFRGELGIIEEKSFSDKVMENVSEDYDKLMDEKYEQIAVDNYIASKKGVK